MEITNFDSENAYVEVFANNLTRKLSSADNALTVRITQIISRGFPQIRAKTKEGRNQELVNSIVTHLNHDITSIEWNGLNVASVKGMYDYLKHLNDFIVENSSLFTANQVLVNGIHRVRNYLERLDPTIIESIEKIEQ